MRRALRLGLEIRLERWLELTEVVQDAELVGMVVAAEGSGELASKLRDIP